MINLYFDVIIAAVSWRSLLMWGGARVLRYYSTSVVRGKQQAAEFVELSTRLSYLSQVQHQPALVLRCWLRLIATRV